MSGLQAPPSADTPTRVISRILVLLVLLFIFGVAVWSAVISQRIPLVEDLSLDDVEGFDEEVSEGVRFHLDDRGESDPPVFLLHDADIAGGVMFEALVGSIGGEMRTVAVDLPGFGFTTRFPSPGTIHTVRDMAEQLMPVIEARSGGPVIIAGVGFGGKVAAEVAATRPDLIAGLVMIDVDFYGGDGWVQALERLPWIGRSMTYAFEVSGPLSDSAGDPYCDQGGWCLSPEQSRVRDIVSEVADTTYSLHAFRNTTPASNVPSRLVDVAAPTIVVWSENGRVSEDSIDELVAAMPDARLETFDVFEAVHEEPDQIASLIASLVP